jgi:protein TonB
MISMDGPAVRFRASPGSHSAGWITSLLLHSTLVFGAFVFTQQLTLAPQPAPFKWTVAMVKPTPSETEQTSAAVSSFGSGATREQPLSSPASPRKSSSALTASSDTTSLAKSVHPKSMSPLSSLPSSISRQESRAVRSITPAPAITTPPAPSEPAAPEQTVVRPIEPSSPPVHSESTSSSSSLLSESESEVGMQAVVSATSPPAAKSELASQQVPIATAPNPSSSSVRQDYSWLSETILRSVEELKRYPSDARLDRAEGKVVLKAVIRGDGSVDDLEISQSSGHLSLDHAALELLKRAAPFQLPQPLGKSQMTVKIPMNYRLEQ